MRDPSPLLKWDSRVLLRINGRTHSPWTSIFRAFSFLGREPIWLGVIAWYLFIYYQVELFVHFGLILLYGLIIVAVLKNITRRPRPSAVLHQVKVLDGPNQSYSFPSWHSYNIMAISLSIAYFTNSSLVLVIGLIISGIVAYSRVCLGVHYPSDVIVGVTCGVPGFFLARGTMPWWVEIVHFFEQFTDFPINEGWNHLLQCWWYWMVIVGVYGGIFLSSIFPLLSRSKNVAVPAPQPHSEGSRNGTL